MNISHSHKFIFVHVPKTGGYSILSALSYDNIGISVKNISPLAAHEPIHSSKHNLSKIKFDNYFKFAFVRNPWDRLYSLYCYYQHHKKNESKSNVYETNGLNHFYEKDFKGWLFSETWPKWDPEKTMDKPYQQIEQLWYITDEDKIAVDHVARFENFANEYQHICKKLRIGYRKLHTNKSERDIDFRPHFDNEMIDFVAEYHTNDIKQFGYTFE